MQQPPLFLTLMSCLSDKNNLTSQTVYVTICNNLHDQCIKLTAEILAISLYYIMVEKIGPTMNLNWLKAREQRSASRESPRGNTV